MKKSIILTSVIALLFSLFSSDIKAQETEGREAGGSDDGFIFQPCPVSFKRNNGNGWGVCHGDAQIRVAFTELPSVIPQITAIIYTESKSGDESYVTTVVLPIDGVIIDKTQPYISYCVRGSMTAPGNSQGNIKPAIKLVLELKYPNGQVCRTDFEE